MDRIDKLAAVAERVADRMNPILVKETRQALKGKLFVVTFIILLTLAWLISALGVLLAGPALEYGSPARAFFSFYFGVLEFSIFFIVPVTVFVNMMSERTQNTFELLSISTLSPRQIVRGKLGSGMVLVFVFYSAIAPFIAFASLLQGFDFGTVIFLLSIGVLWAFFVCTFALMVSTLAKSRVLQGIIGITLFLLLIWQTIGSMVFLVWVMTEPMPLHLPEFKWAMGCVLAVVASYMFLFQQVAVARLTFESDNRSTGIRIVCAAQFWMIWIALWLFAWQFGWSVVVWQVIMILASVSAIHWMLIGLLASTEEDYISRRIRRGMPKHPLLRVLVAPWLPGGARGFIYLLMHLAALLVIVLAGDWPEEVDNLTIAIACYVVSYIGFGSCVGRWGREITPEIKPVHVRVLTVIMISMSVFAPYILPLLGFIEYPVGYSLMEISNPFKTLLLIGDTPGAPQINVVIYLLMGIATVAVLLNLKPMIKGVTDLVRFRMQETGEAIRIDEQNASALKPHGLS